MNIAQISNLQGRGAGLLTSMLTAAPLLQVAEFQLEASDHLLVTGRETASGSSAKNEGDAALRTQATPDVNPRKLRIYRREVAVDDLRRRDVQAGNTTPQGLLNFYDQQLLVEARGIAREFQDEAFIGIDAADGNGKYRMLGFSEFVKDAAAAGQTSRFGFSTADIAAMNTQVGLQLNTTANQDAFVEMLIKKLAEVPGANALLVNVNLAARLTTIAKRIGAAGESTTTFGTQVSAFNRVPIIALPVSSIPQTESDGTNNDCTSAYIVRFEETTGVAFTTNSGFDFTDFDTSSEIPSGIARLQLFVNLAVQSRDAVRRLSRIRL